MGRHPQKDRVIVLKTVPFEDRHQIITGISENFGIISAMARNSKHSRRFGGALGIFCASEWIYTEKENAELKHVTEARPLRSFEGLSQDFELLSIASTLNEILLKSVAHNEPCEPLFRLHSNALDILEEESSISRQHLLLVFYCSKILQWTGHQPHIQNCLHCGSDIRNETQNKIYASPEKAGWSCQPNVFEAIEMSAETFGVIALGLAYPLKKAMTESENIESTEIQTLLRFLLLTLSYHLPNFEPSGIKSLRFLDLESIQPMQTNHHRSNPHPEQR